MAISIVPKVQYCKRLTAGRTQSFSTGNRDAVV